MTRAAKTFSVLSLLGPVMINKYDSRGHLQLLMRLCQQSVTREMEVIVIRQSTKDTT